MIFLEYILVEFMKLPGSSSREKSFGSCPANFKAGQQNCRGRWRYGESRLGPPNALGFTVRAWQKIRQALSHKGVSIALLGVSVDQRPKRSYHHANDP
jgi:hypothetical protein